MLSELCVLNALFSLFFEAGFIVAYLEGPGSPARAGAAEIVAGNGNASKEEGKRTRF